MAAPLGSLPGLGEPPCPALAVAPSDGQEAVTQCHLLPQFRSPLGEMLKEIVLSPSQNKGEAEEGWTREGPAGGVSEVAGLNLILSISL